MNDIVFALDASGKTAGACLLCEETVLAEENLAAGRTHSETLLPLVQRVFAAGGLSPQDVSLWAITGGPGSFTGLRIGMALLKGMAFPYEAPVAAVSTLEALARASGLCGTVIPALDARREEVYWATFHQKETFHRLCEDTASPVDALAETVAAAEGPVFFVGDGAKICYNRFGFHPHVHPAAVPALLPIAKGAAMAALQMRRTSALQAPAGIRPQYLRLPQAERERRARILNA